MIAFDEALARMMAAARPLPSETVALNEAAGRILAADIHADLDMPPFDKAAMDGYACRREDLAAGPLDIIEEIPAGAWPREAVRPGTCSRILTGAPVPEGADCVIMQEQTERQGARLRIVKADTPDNICRKAEDIRSGDLVLRRGERLSPAHIAVLATVGVTEPRVARRPRVAVLATGNELVEPTCRPGPAQIRNSNSWQLVAQVRAMGGLPSYSGIFADDENVMSAAIAAAMEASDVILLSGGVSTGDYDLGPGVLRKLGFDLVFENVAMQPGHPTIFGRKGTLYGCGLPGNPVSTYVVFELLVKPFLYRLMGHELRPVIVEARLAQPIRRGKTRRQAGVPVRFVTPGEVVPLDYHGSAHIQVMTQADGIVVVPIGLAGFETGDTVRVRSFST